VVEAGTSKSETEGLGWGRWSEWVSSFLTAHQHIIGYSVPWGWWKELGNTQRCLTCFNFIFTSV